MRNRGRNGEEAAPGHGRNQPDSIFEARHTARVRTLDGEVDCFLRPIFIRYYLLHEVTSLPALASAAQLFRYGRRHN